MAQADPIDIGAAFKFATSDPDWWKKMLVAGLVILIPLIGLVAMLGWMREIFFRVREGKEGLPSMDLGRHMGEGWTPLVAVLNLSLLAIPILFPMLCAGGFIAVGQETGNESLSSLGLIFMMISQGIVMLLSLGMNFIAPEVWRRGFHGELGPLFSFGSSLRTIREHAMPCLLVFVGFLAANLVASVGVFACYIGVFLTMPLAYVVQAHLLAQWDAIVTGHTPTPEEEWELAQKA